MKLAVCSSSTSRDLLAEVRLEPRKDAANLFRSALVDHGVGDGIVVSQRPPSLRALVSTWEHQ
jgi:hypothetical protein